MTAGPVQAYEKGISKIQNQSIDWLNDDIQALLLVDGHVSDLVNQEFVSEVIGNEHPLTGNYVRQTLAAKTSAVVAGEHRFSSGDVNFGADTTIAARYLVLFKNTGNDATSPLIFIGDLNIEGGNLSSANGTFQVTPNASGWHLLDINQ